MFENEGGDIVCAQCATGVLPFEARLTGYVQGLLPLHEFTRAEQTTATAYTREAENRKLKPAGGTGRTRPGTMAHDLTLMMTPGQPRRDMCEAEFKRLTRMVEAIHAGDYTEDK